MQAIRASDLSASYLRELPPKKVKRILRSLDPADAEQLLWCWEFWARPKQLEPPGDWFTWLIRSGRGFGKTRTGAETVRKWATSGVTSRILIGGRTASDVRSLMIEGPSGLLAVHPPHERPIYEPSKRLITWPNGTIGEIRYGEEPDSFRGFEGGRGWLDELFHWKDPQTAWDTLIMGMREARGGDGNIRMLVTSTPKPTKFCKDLSEEADTVDIVGSTFDNAANLSPKYIAKMRSRFAGTRFGKQELYGEILMDSPGALWKWEQIARNRVQVCPELTQIVIAADPAATYGEKSDETGIVVVGLGSDGHCYLLEDVSGKYRPEEWATVVWRLYMKWKANRVVIETNMGGDMVEHTLRMVDRNLPIRRVHAKKGKRTRAEPVAMLSEQNKVHHVGDPDQFAVLEGQLCTVDLAEQKELDDRLDAYVYAITDLAIGGYDGLSTLEAMI